MGARRDERGVREEGAKGKEGMKKAKRRGKKRKRVAARKDIDTPKHDQRQKSAMNKPNETNRFDIGLSPTPGETRTMK